MYSGVSYGAKNWSKKISRQPWKYVEKNLDFYFVCIWSRGANYVINISKWGRRKAWMVFDESW